MMELLREYESYITSRVETLEILEDIHTKAFLCDRDYEEIINLKGTFQNPLIDNRNQFQRLLEIVDKYKDDSECVFRICDFIHEEHPNVSIHIPQIHSKQRLQLHLSVNTVLTITKGDQGLQFDIRKMVSDYPIIIYITRNIVRILLQCP